MSNYTARKNNPKNQIISVNNFPKIDFGRNFKSNI